MRLKIIPACFLLILLISACSPPRAALTGGSAIQSANATAQAGAAKSMLETVVARTLAVSPTPVLPSLTPTPTLAPTATPAPAQASVQANPGAVQARPHYKLDVEFSYGERYGKVAEEITYTNHSVDTLNELRLMVELNTIKDIFSFTGLWWADGQKIENTSWENVQVHIPLRQPLPPGQTVALKLTYEFRLPSQSEVAGDRPMPIGYTARQANLVDWYPFIPPYRSGTGWMAYPPAYYGEHLVYELSDFEVNLHLTDQRKDLVVAASAPAQADGDWLRYQRLGARSFALSIGSEYQVQTAQIGNIKVSSYFFPLNDKAGAGALQTTLEALDLYQKLFGPYPHDTLAVVEADFYDGMEYDGLYFLSRAFYNLYSGKPEDYLVAIAAHETAHQWWYGVVGSDQANAPWMDEALSTYCEKLYYEHYAPNSLKWWWYYRVDYYKPQGWVDSSVYNPKGTLQTYQDYRNAVYLNGAHFFEELRHDVGEDNFFAFLKDYATKYAGQVALSSDFLALLHQHTKADLTPLLTKYFANH